MCLQRQLPAVIGACHYTMPTDVEQSAAPTLSCRIRMTMGSLNAPGVAECRRLFPNQQLVVLWLGSSIGNLNPAEAVQFFQDMTASAGTNIQVRAELKEL